MDLIQRKDAAFQDLLRPSVDQLKKKRQTKNKGKKESSKPNKIKTIRDLKSSRQLVDTEAIVGKVVHKSDLQSYVTKKNETKAFFNLVVADKTASIEVMVYGKERLKEIRKRSCYMFKKVIVEGNIIKVTKLTTVFKTKAINIPAKVLKEAQMITDQMPASSKAQTSAQKMPVNVQGTVNGIGPGKPVKSKQKKTGTQSKGTKVTPKTTKLTGKKESSKPNKIKTIRDLKSSRQLVDTEAIVGKVVHKSDLRSYVTNNETKAFFNLVVADKTASIEVMVYGKERLKEIRKRSCYMFKKVIVEGNIIKVTKLTTVFKTKAINIPAKVLKEAQMITDQMPASSKAQTSAQKMPVNVQGTVNGIGPGKPVKSKQKKTGTQSKGTKVTQKTTKLTGKKESSKPNKIGPGKPVKSKQKKTGTQSKGTKVTPKTTKLTDKHFVDEHRAKLIQRVTNIDPILDELLAGEFIQSETYSNIRVPATSQGQMRELYKALNAGDEIKDAFYNLLEKHERCLVRDIKKKKTKRT